jgi:hypothetical protein
MPVATPGGAATRCALAGIVIHLLSLTVLSLYPGCETSDHPRGTERAFGILLTLLLSVLYNANRREARAWVRRDRPVR